MNKLSFFDADFHTEQPFVSTWRGLCDPDGTAPAYTTVNRKDNWVAEIKNPDAKEVLFVPVDNNIPIFKPNGSQASRCDGMLRYDRTVYFVELKIDRQLGRAFQKAKEQLEATIDVFLQNHIYTDFKVRRAYISNRKRKFNQSYRKEASDFRRRYHFSLFCSTVLTVE